MAVLWISGQCLEGVWGVQMYLKVKSGQVKSGQGKSGQVESQGRSCQDRSSLNRSSWDRSSQFRITLDMSSQNESS